MQSLLSLLLASLCVGCLASQGYFDYRAWTAWDGTCADGKKQSPINIDLRDTKPSPPRSGKARLNSFGTVGKYTVYFTGTRLQIEFKKEDFIKKPYLYIAANDFTTGNSTKPKKFRLLRVTPKEFHFHTPSEHTYNGYHSPGELHMVATVDKLWSSYCDKYGPCYAVFGVMMTHYGEGDKGKRVFDKLIADPPIKAGKDNGYVVEEPLDLDTIVPSNRGHYRYLGSLTTPPCTESVTWHVFKDSVGVSKGFIKLHQELVSMTWGADCMWKTYGYCFPPREKTNNRQIQPHHARRIYDVSYYEDEAGEAVVGAQTVET